MFNRAALLTGIRAILFCESHEDPDPKNCRHRNFKSDREFFYAQSQITLNIERLRPTPCPQGPDSRLTGSKPYRRRSYLRLCLRSTLGESGARSSRTSTRAFSGFAVWRRPISAQSDASKQRCRAMLRNLTELNRNAWSAQSSPSLQLRMLVFGQLTNVSWRRATASPCLRPYSTQCAL